MSEKMSSNGALAPAQEGQFKPRPTLLPARALLAISELMTLAGRGKHSDEKWRHISPDEHIDAALRHLLKRGAGERVDPEFGTDHAINAGARILMAIARLMEEAGRATVPELCPAPQTKTLD